MIWLWSCLMVQQKLSEFLQSLKKGNHFYTRPQTFFLSNFKHDKGPTVRILSTTKKVYRRCKSRYFQKSILKFLAPNWQFIAVVIYKASDNWLTLLMDILQRFPWSQWSLMPKNIFKIGYGTLFTFSYRFFFIGVGLVSVPCH